MAAKKQNEITAWDSELAEIAAAEASKELINDMIPSLSIKNGILKLDDTALPGNRIAVVIACNVLENAFYNTTYDPDIVVAPVCYAFGENPNDMAPIAENVKDIQSETCAGCQNNEFGSADTGKGKACGNRRKLVCIPAGEYDKKTSEWIVESNAEEYLNATPAILSIPPTSLIEFAKYIKSLAKEYKRPVASVITEIKIVPDEKKQFVVKFNVLDEVTKDIYDAVTSRVDDFKEAVMRPYTYTQDEEERKPAKAKKATPRANSKMSKPRGK